MPLVAEGQAAQGAIAGARASWRRSAASRRRCCGRLPCAASRPRRWSFRRCAAWPTCRNRLPDKHAVLAFFATSRRLVRIPAEQRAVHVLADRLAAGVGQADAGHAPRDGPVSAEPRVGRQGPRRRQVEAVGETDVGDAVEGLAGRFHAALRRTGGRARRRPLVLALRGVAGDGRRAVAAVDCPIPHPLCAHPVAGHVARSRPQSGGQHGRGGGQTLSARRGRRGPPGVRPACRGRARRRGAPIAGAGAVVDLPRVVPAAGRARRPGRLRARPLRLGAGADRPGQRRAGRWPTGSRCRGAGRT